MINSTAKRFQELYNSMSQSGQQVASQFFLQFNQPLIDGTFSAADQEKLLGTMELMYDNDQEMQRTLAAKPQAEPAAPAKTKKRGWKFWTAVGTGGVVLTAAAVWLLTRTNGGEVVAEVVTDVVTEGADSVGEVVTEVVTALL